MAVCTEEDGSRWPGERNFVLLICGLFFWAGTLLAERLAYGLWLWAALGLAVILGVLLRRLGKRAGVALAFALLCLGALRTLPCLNPAMPEPGVYERITGFVYGEARPRTDKRIAFTLTDVALDGKPMEGRAYCSLYYGDDGPPTLFDGAALVFSGRVYLPEGKSGAPRFDFRRWMLQSGMSYGIAISQGVAVGNTPESAPVKDWASRLRAAIRSSLQRVMGEDAGLAMAMLVSDREGVSEEEYAAFRRLGVAHVMSVSGLHVGILGYALLWLMEKARLRKSLRLIPLLLFLSVYCGLTGFSAASMRASVMLILTLLCQLWGRRGDSLTTLGASMLVVLLIDPLQGSSAGFLLSFSAVAGIFWLTPGLRMGLERLLPEGRHRAARPRNLREWGDRFLHWARLKVKGTLCVSLGAQLGVLLPAAMCFHSVPLYGVAVNLAIIPLVELLLPMYGLTLLLSPLPTAGAWAGWVAARCGRFLLWLVRLLSQLPYASVRVSSPAALLVAAGMLILFVLSRVCRGGFRRKALAAALIVLIAGGSVYALRPPEVRYVQLAVGQADAALLFDRDKTVAIDVGADGSATLDYLMDAGRDLDALVLTHLHLDHAGGVQAILDAGVRIRQAYLPVNGEKQRLEPDSLAVLEALESAHVPVTRLAKGDVLRFRATELRVLWPDGCKVRSGQDANDLPLVLDVRLGEYSLLNMSDLTGAYERYAVQPCDVLKAAHHGSDKSTGDAFLSAAAPAYAIVSCSSGSRSLPGKAMLERLGAHGIPAFRTDASGDVTLWVDEQGELRLAPYKGGESP